MWTLFFNAALVTGDLSFVGASPLFLRDLPATLTAPVPSGVLPRPAPVYSEPSSALKPSLSSLKPRIPASSSQSLISFSITPASNCCTAEVAACRACQMALPTHLWCAQVANMFPGCTGSDHLPSPASSLTAAINCCSFPIAVCMACKMGLPVSTFCRLVDGISTAYEGCQSQRWLPPTESMPVNPTSHPGNPDLSTSVSGASVGTQSSQQYQVTRPPRSPTFCGVVAQCADCTAFSGCVWNLRSNSCVSDTFSLPCRLDPMCVDRAVLCLRAASPAVSIPVPTSPSPAPANFTPIPPTEPLSPTALSAAPSTAGGTTSGPPVASSAAVRPPCAFYSSCRFCTAQSGCVWSRTVSSCRTASKRECLLTPGCVSSSLRCPSIASVSIATTPHSTSTNSSNSTHAQLSTSTFATTLNTATSSTSNSPLVSPGVQYSPLCSVSYGCHDCTKLRGCAFHNNVCTLSRGCVVPTCKVWPEQCDL